MMKMEKLSVGNRIREVRKARGLTQEQLAEMANMSSAYLGEIERGKKVIGLDKFINIINALGLSADYVLCNELQSGEPYVFDDLTARLKDLDLKQRKTVLDIVDGYLKNI